MTRQNMLLPVIEKAFYKNNSFLEKDVTGYMQWYPGIYAPENFQHQKQGNNIETRLTYRYNSQDQLQATVKDGFQKVVYIRNAYSQPLAVIEQADYSEVATVLGVTFIERLSGSFTVSDTDMATLNRLRDNLPGALVTTYTYQPLVGMTSKTDPRKVTVHYEYDGFGRLKRSYYKENGLEKNIERYDYHYKNQ